MSLCQSWTAPYPNLILPSEADSSAVRKEMTKGPGELDRAIIFDTFAPRAEQVATLLQLLDIPTVEIRPWQDIQDERTSTRRELEVCLDAGQRILVISNYHSIPALRDVETAIASTGTGTRNWVISCESGKRIRSKKERYGVTLPTIHLPWSSTSDSRIFQERLWRCLSSHHAPHSSIGRRKPR